MSTIVGSWPHRRTLPDGDEANARALRMCRFWKCEYPEEAAREAWDSVGCPPDLPPLILEAQDRRDEIAWSSAGWLPDRAHAHAHDCIVLNRILAKGHRLALR